MRRATRPTKKMERVLNCLDELSLSAAKEELSTLLDKANKQGVELIEGLDVLLNTEVLYRRERRKNRRIKEARFPELKSLDDYNFNFPDKINVPQIRALTELTFLKEALNVIISGQSGTGKSHIAMSLGLLACGREYRVRYTSCPGMLNDLYAALADHTLDKTLRRYVNPDLLIIDDLGTEKVEIVHGQGAALFFKVINKRHGNKSTIITSNLDTDKWSEHFGDPNTTVAALDRFTQHAIPVVIEGNSFRVKLMEERLLSDDEKKGKKKERKATRKKK